MSCAKEMKTRIQSIKSTQQITKAMKMVSAAKLYKAQRQVLAAKPYSMQLQHLLARLLKISSEDAQIALLQDRPVQHTAVILITGNRGLVGGFHHNLIKAALSLKDETTQFIAVGKKGRDGLVKAGCTVAESFCGIGDSVTFEDIQPLGHYILEAYQRGQYDSVKVVYQKYISSGCQQPCVTSLLPIMPQTVEEDTDESRYAPQEYIFEGELREILDALAEKYVYKNILQAAMETKTSEHIARMLCMNTATDNAGEMLKKLQIDYNRARQAAITSEIAEISSNTDVTQ